MDQIFGSYALFEAQALLVGAFHVVIAGAVTVHALMTKRDVPAAIGWIGMAWLAPVLGALLYVGFGVNRVKRRARRLMGTDRSDGAHVTGDMASEDPLERLKGAIGKITGQDTATGKVVAILECGDQAYPQMLAAIDGAKSHVRLASYIFRTDEVGHQFIEALSRAHLRGVKVRVLIDGFGGGFLLSPAFRALRRRGVPAARFLHSLLPWKMPFLDLRLHKKILVVDGETAFVGGLNIGAENVIAKRQKAPVRDTHFRVEGTIIRQIEQEFDDDWSFTTGQDQVRSDSAHRDAGGRRNDSAHDCGRPGPGSRSADSGPPVGDQSGAAFHSDRHALFSAGRAAHHRPPAGGAARGGCAYRIARAQQPSAGGLGGHPPHAAAGGNGMPSMAKCAAIRSLEIDDDRWSMEFSSAARIGTYEAFD